MPVTEPLGVGFDRQITAVAQGCRLVVNHGPQRPSDRVEPGFRNLAGLPRVIAAGKHKIIVDTQFDSPKPMAPATVTVTVDGKEVAKTVVARTVPAAFTASESFDVGVDLGSTVSPVYDERRPFAFSGKISTVKVDLKK